MLKRMYEAPDVEMFEVQVEEGFATSTVTGDANAGQWGVTDESGDDEWK